MEPPQVVGLFQSLRFASWCGQPVREADNPGTGGSGRTIFLEFVAGVMYGPEGYGPGMKELVGALVGKRVGARVGGFVGIRVGDRVGRFVGIRVGDREGDFVGLRVGRCVGRFVGIRVGDRVGGFIGAAVGRQLRRHSFLQI